MTSTTLPSFLSLDLELNQRSIIQVGLVIGSVDQSPDQYVVKSWYVKPSNNLPVEERITKLTGITRDHIDQCGVDHATLSSEISTFIRSYPYPLFPNPVQWGHDDAQILLSECREAGAPLSHFGHRVVDVKTIFTFLGMARGNNVRRASLRSALRACKLEFIGTPHQAPDDALNTLRLYSKLLKDFKANS